MHTYCVFKEVKNLDFPFLNNKPDYISKSGSMYYYTEIGVYRLSNHWGRAANCRWRLDALATKNTNDIHVGYAEWSNFYDDNDTDKLYCIVMTDVKPMYHHKEEQIAEGRILRTASETHKAIKQIEGIKKRAKYLEVKQLNEQINKLIFK
ncbi:hypothetical protein NBRC110019_08230 [Neptunitalea chrysea]|uniref:Uncharacterized protein n=1 Tax=Neptunitalea chrysea TaxID=1647581 RepID=A0A9W6ETW5_9FLAO|nr:hypothetical protein [Neptunitalea chrysea]GLB51784.1 hypothetical protein NBRC110019_08230 [Neptunitalea chrysea]